MDKARASLHFIIAIDAGGSIYPPAQVDLFPPRTPCGCRLLWNARLVHVRVLMHMDLWQELRSFSCKASFYLCGGHHINIIYHGTAVGTATVWELYRANRNETRHFLCRVCDNALLRSARLVLVVPRCL